MIFFNREIDSRLIPSIARVASVSVRFRRKERGTRVKDREKSGASKRPGRGWGRKEGKERFLPSPPRLSLFGSRFISRAVKTESPLPWYFFAPKPNGNACYTGYTQYYILISLFSFVCFVYSLLFGTNCYISFHAFTKITLYFVARLSSTTSIFLEVLCLQYVQHFHPGSLCNEKPPRETWLTQR